MTTGRAAVTAGGPETVTGGGRAAREPTAGEPVTVTAGAGDEMGGVTGEWRPALAPAIVLRHDSVRGADLLVMPERIVVLNGEAAAVLRLCDGGRTVAEIVDELRDAFPGAPVADDVPEFLGRVRTEGWVR
ncbi:pyrroloquinoline quinone biosynthesis peptide chaperone PqqD [Streptosporangium sp. NPDC051022]|uniref:pyrroloquinoline quinone biosynthesis peptide chaperone PqqD n=1 Tax=Streptosporangium sp. NPDC051022 TaxID=3155752 RepID=UPI0034430490